MIERLPTESPDDVISQARPVSLQKKALQGVEAACAHVQSIHAPIGGLEWDLLLSMASFSALSEFLKLFDVVKVSRAVCFGFQIDQVVKRTK